MKVYKLEVMVIDFDELGGDEISSVIENSRYPNRCISPDVTNIDSAEIGEWSDNHPLNNSRTCGDEYKRLFERKSDG